MRGNSYGLLGALRLLAASGIAVLFLHGGAEGARLKDIARIDVGGEAQLVGYGLVVGLDGTGDSKSSIFTMQSMANMLNRLGVTVPEEKMRAKNAAAVMVVAKLNRFHRKGSKIDVTVSSIGDATSLQGGTLLLTPLSTPDGPVLVTAQGPVSVGGFSVSGAGSDKSSQNYVLVGRVPGGGLVEHEWSSGKRDDTVTVILGDPDYTTAQRVAESINGDLGDGTAKALDASTITFEPPAELASDRVALLSRIEMLDVEPDAAARVVVNEKTGTIVAGEHVTIASVAIAHGNLSVEISGQPVISQPAPFSQGETVQTEDTQIRVESEDRNMVAMKESANVGDLAKALNALGVTPRDMIAIFQALKEAGALRAELRII